MRDKVEIERRIAELRAELGRVEGRPTEVYSRIVGYYRSVRNWNAGKREEYGARLMYRMPAQDRAVRDPAARTPAASAIDGAERDLAERKPEAAAESEAGGARGGELFAAAPAAAFAPPSRPTPASVLAAGALAVPAGAKAVLEGKERSAARISRNGMLVFTRAACPSCPPVKDYVAKAGLPAVFVDVDAAEGLALARRHGVLATPTVVGIATDGSESFRAYGLGELKSRLSEGAGLSL